MTFRFHCQNCGCNSYLTDFNPAYVVVQCCICNHRTHIAEFVRNEKGTIAGQQASNIVRALQAACCLVRNEHRAAIAEASRRLENLLAPETVAA